MALQLHCKIISYLFVISELTVKISLNKYIYKRFRQDISALWSHGWNKESASQPSPHKKHKLNSAHRNYCLTTACTKVLIPRAFSFTAIPESRPISLVLVVIKILPSSSDVTWETQGIAMVGPTQQESGEQTTVWQLKCSIELSSCDCCDVNRRLSPNSSFRSSLIPMAKFGICLRKWRHTWKAI